SDILAHDHIRKLQLVLTSEWDRLHLPFLVCLVGGVRNFSDHGTEPTIHRTDDDIQRTTAKRAWNNMRSHHECSIPAEIQNRGTASPVRVCRPGLARWRCARGLPGRRL